MKRMKFLFIIILFFLINESLNYKTTEICQKNKNDYMKCPKKFSVKCCNTMCAASKLDCHRFIVYEEFLKQISKDNSIFKKDLEIFYSKVQNCPRNWSTNDVCVNIKKCFYKPKIWSIASIPKILLKCLCPKSYSYKCGENFCSKDKIACDGFDLKKFKATKFENCNF